MAYRQPSTAVRSPVFGAFALLVIVAVPATALAWHAAHPDEHVGVSASLVGTMLIAWIAVELAFIRQFSWLQPAYVGVGITLLVIGRRVRTIGPGVPSARVRGAT